MMCVQHRVVRSGGVPRTMPKVCIEGALVLVSSVCTLQKCYTEKATEARHRPERQYNACDNRKKQCRPNETNSAEVYGLQYVTWRITCRITQNSMASPRPQMQAVQCAVCSVSSAAAKLQR